MLKKKQNKVSMYNDRYLYPLEKKYIFELKEWRNAQMKVLRQFEPLSDSHQEKWYFSLKDDKSQVLFALMAGEVQKPKFIGYCGITNIDFRNKKGEISFLVEPKRALKKEIYKKDFWAALYMLCEYGFENVSLNRIFADTYEFRKEHIRILENFGFYKEGELREQYFDDGKYFNSFIHSILSSEWGLLKNKNK